MKLASLLFSLCTMANIITEVTATTPFPIASASLGSDYAEHPQTDWLNHGQHIMKDGWTNPRVHRQHASTSRQQSCVGQPESQDQEACKTTDRTEQAHYDPVHQSACRDALADKPSELATGKLVAKTENGSMLGYLSPAGHKTNGYMTLSKNIEDGFIVSFNYCQVGDTSYIDILTLGSSVVADSPFLGAITGLASSSSDLGAGSSNYNLIFGTPQTALGSTPQHLPESFISYKNSERSYESAIWNYSPTTREITAQWTNTDGSLPTTYVAITDEILVITGDVGAFSYDFSPATKLNLFLVSVE